LINVTLDNGAELTYCELGQDHQEILVTTAFYFHTFMPVVEELAKRFHVYALIMRFDGPTDQLNADGTTNWARQWGKDLYDFCVKKEDGTLYGWSEKNQRREGLGADNKNGIWVCLRCLEECPRLKVFMAVGEEKGCIGSNHANMSFFADSLYVLEPDCKGGEEIHTNLKGIPCASPDFEQTLLETDSQFKIQNSKSLPERAATSSL